MHDFEAQAYRKEHAVVWLSLSARAVRDDAGDLVGYEGIVEDVTARKESELELREYRERLSATYNQAAVGISEVDLEGRFQAVNDRFCEITGYGREELLSRRFQDITHQDDVHTDAKLFRQLQDGEIETYRLEKRYVHKNGAIVWAEFNASLVRDGLGKPSYRVGLIQDITARKNAEDARKQIEDSLQRERERMNNTVSNVPGVVWEAYGRPDEESQQIDFVSEYVEEMLGYSVEEWLATPNFWLKIVHPDDRERAAADSAAICAGAREPINEFRWVTKDGRTVWVEAQSSVIRDGAGNPIGMRGVTMDITERKREEERQAFLAEASAILAASLDYEKTLDNVARLVVGGIADLCSIDMVEDGLVRCVALAHTDPEREELFTGMDPVYRPGSRRRHPVLRVTQTRRSELVNGISDATLKDAARDDAHLRTLRALGARSVMVVPLAAGPRTLGAVTIVSAESGREYDQADLALAEELARHAALAIENARLFQDAQNARETAERAANRTARLQAVTAALSGPLTVAEVGDTVLGAAMAAMDTRSGLVVALTSDGQLEAITMKGVSNDFLASWQEFAEKPPEEVLRAMEGGQPFFAESAEALVAAFPSLSSLAPVVGRSFACMPLTVEGHTTGAMVLTFPYTRGFREEDQEFILALGHQCAQAMERARLYEAETRARAIAEEARQRVEFLAATSPVFLSGSVDSEDALQRLAELVVPRLADWCSVHLLDPEGNLRVAAVHHRDADKLELAATLQENYRPDPDARRGSANVVRTAESELYPTISDELLEMSAQDAKQLEILRALGLKSAICAPLTARGKTLGAMTFVTAESGRLYTEEDRELVEELCNRAALAIDNAGLYEAEQKARAAAEAAQQRLWFLAEANAMLSSSLDFDTTLARVAGLAVPWLADCCVAHVFPDEGVEARFSICHADQRMEELVQELHSRYVPAPDEPHPLMQMIETRAPVLMEEIDETALEGIIRDDRQHELLALLGFKSYMAVPLIARGRLFGALTFATAVPGRRYTQQDLSLAEELARRGALALDNARLYDDAQRVQEALRVALEAKDEFLGVMSHELRTPITAIYGGARVLRSRGERLDEESKSRLMEDIEQESERLFRLVENLLVLSRLELGQEVATEPVLAQRVVGKLVSAFGQRRPTRPVLVNVSEEMAPVAAEPHYLEQVLRNLLTNADKYSPPESPIEITIQLRDGEADISVLDRGSGITAEETEIIFERFYRSDRTASHAAGIGLGLTVCKRLTEAQAGRIWARLREGVGLEVGVTLPLYKEVAS